MKSHKARKYIHAHEEIDVEGTWAISYGDMVTLLLTFFIVFFSIKPSQKDDKAALKVALIEKLKSTSEALTDVEDADGGKKAVQRGPQAELAKKWPGQVHDTKSGVLVEFPGISFFESGSIKLTKEGQKALNEFIQVYQPYAGNYHLSVRAFTDTKKVIEKPGRAFKDNLDLSALRALSATRAMQKSGIPLDKIKIGGYGENLETAKELSKLQEKPNESLVHKLSRKIVILIQPEEGGVQ
jgi:flagellar motor protein MotB